MQHHTYIHDVENPQLLLQSHARFENKQEASIASLIKKTIGYKNRTAVRKTTMGSADNSPKPRPLHTKLRDLV